MFLASFKVTKSLEKFLTHSFCFTARLLSIKDINPADYINELDNFLLDVSVLAFLATLWVTFVFIISR